jgi:hypothetical protein
LYGAWPLSIFGSMDDDNADFLTGFEKILDNILLIVIPFSIIFVGWAVSLMFEKLDGIIFSMTALTVFITQALDFEHSLFK